MTQLYSPRDAAPQFFLETYPLYYVFHSQAETVFLQTNLQFVACCLVINFGIDRGFDFCLLRLRLVFKCGI